MFLPHTNRGEASCFRPELDSSSRGGQRANHLTVVLQDLHRLLEDYAPRWYTYEHHRRGSSLCDSKVTAQAEALVMLYSLLEEYAPPWYASDLREEARLAAENLEKVATRAHDGSRKPTAYP